MCKKPSKPRLRHLPVDLMQNQDEVSGHLTMVLRLSKYVSNKCIAVRKVATLLRELTCHMGSHSVTCYPAEVTFPPLPQPKWVLD